MNSGEYRNDWFVAKNCVFALFRTDMHCNVNASLLTAMPRMLVSTAVLCRESKTGLSTTTTLPSVDGSGWNLAGMFWHGLHFRVQFDHGRCMGASRPSFFSVIPKCTITSLTYNGPTGPWSRWRTLLIRNRNEPYLPLLSRPQLGNWYSFTDPGGMEGWVNLSVK